MTTKLERQLFVSALFLVSILSFQNCGKPAFNPDGGFMAPSSHLGDDPGTDSDGDSGGAPTPTPTPVIGPSPSPSPTPAPTPTPTPTPAPGQAYVLVATGFVGRTVISCDQGRTWIRDRSDNQNTRCWVDGNPNYVECDHTANSGRNIEYGDGWFYAAYGWGSNAATLRKSRDGYNWQTIATGNSGAGVSYYQGFLLWINGGGWPGSTNGGMSFTNYEPSNIPNFPGAYSIRTLARSEGLIVASGDDPGGLYSRDAGRTWSRATLNGIEWTRTVQLARGNGQLISLSSNTVNNQGRLYVARSTDNGATWNGASVASVPAYENWSSLIFNGTQFITWSSGKRWMSVDGLNWTATNMNSQHVNGPVALTPNGTYVSIPNFWGQYYAGQRAYYSTDGLNWTQAQFPGGHPISKIVGGYVDAAACQ